MKKNHLVNELLEQTSTIQHHKIKFQFSKLTTSHIFWLSKKHNKFSYHDRHMMSVQMYFTEKNLSDNS